MLSYQHEFHAGNHADILKHYVLLSVLNSLAKKDKPCAFFDSHAGTGIYDLYDGRSIKTGEARNGIMRLAAARDIPPELAPYMEFARGYLDSGRYPGSPEFERRLLPSGSSLVLSELHPAESGILRKNMRTAEHEKPSAVKVSIHERNGFEMLRALTPPQIKRGGLIIDPSYEEASDYTDTAETIISVHKKWASAVMLVWYPLIACKQDRTAGMLNRMTSEILASAPHTEMVDLRLCVNSPDSHSETSLEDYDRTKNPPRLYGSGILVINAPWHLDEYAAAALKFIAEKTGIPGKSSSEVRKITGRT